MMENIFCDHSQLRRESPWTINSGLQLKLAKPFPLSRSGVKDLIGFDSDL